MVDKDIGERRSSIAVHPEYDVVSAAELFINPKRFIRIRPDVPFRKARGLDKAVGKEIWDSLNHFSFPLTPFGKAKEATYRFGYVGDSVAGSDKKDIQPSSSFPFGFLQTFVRDDGVNLRLGVHFPGDHAMDYRKQPFWENALVLLQPVLDPPVFEEVFSRFRVDKPQAVLQRAPFENLHFLSELPFYVIHHVVRRSSSLWLRRNEFVRLQTNDL